LPDDSTPDIPVPSGWPKNVKSAVLHVISLAQYAIVATRGWAADALNPRARQSAENDQLKQEIQLLREELRLKDARVAKIDPRHRPYYPPTERLAILELKAVRGWSLAQAARTFLVEPDTIASWLKRVDETGSSALVQLQEPVNKFPDFVRHIVQRLKVLCPSLGKVKIAQVLARAGLHLCATTVGRMLKAKTPTPKPTETSAAQIAVDESPRTVTAKRPNHVWHVDLTLVPIGSGFWAPWLPFSLSQRWPFCWWIAAVIDHFSRKAMGIAVFHKQPNSKQVCQFLARTIRSTAKPKYIVCDKGSQFWCLAFKRWCRRRGIKPRFGAVGHYGSLAVIERFIRTMKEEGLRRILVPLNLRKMREELTTIVCWYNTHRPHSWLGGRTPEERYRRIPAACRRPRFEPRPQWPVGSTCASPLAKVRGKPGVKLQLAVAWHEDRKHLPIVTLKRVA
jgi:putative transposase